MPIKNTHSWNHHTTGLPQRRRRVHDFVRSPVSGARLFKSTPSSPNQSWHMPNFTWRHFAKNMVKSNETEQPAERVGRREERITHTLGCQTRVAFSELDLAHWHSLHHDCPFQSQFSADQQLLHFPHLDLAVFLFFSHGFAVSVLVPERKTAPLLLTQNLKVTLVRHSSFMSRRRLLYVGIRWCVRPSFSTACVPQIAFLTGNKNKFHVWDQNLPRSSLQWNLYLQTQIVRLHCAAWPELSSSSWNTTQHRSVQHPTKTESRFYHRASNHHNLRGRETHCISIQMCCVVFNPIKTLIYLVLPFASFSSKNFWYVFSRAMKPRKDSIRKAQNKSMYQVHQTIKPTQRLEYLPLPGKSVFKLRRICVAVNIWVARFSS